MCAQIVDSGFFGWRGENFHELQIRATTLAVMVDDICRRNIRLPTYVYVYFRWLAAGTLSFWQRSRERELRIKYAFQRRMRFFNWDCCVCVRYAHLAANLCMSATTRQQRNADQKKKRTSSSFSPPTQSVFGDRWWDHARYAVRCVALWPLFIRQNVIRS